MATFTLDSQRESETYFISIISTLVKGKKGRYSSSWEPHLRATGRHLAHGITQCYLPPDTSKRPLTPAMQAGTHLPTPQGWKAELT